jgi:hypothetical protein
VVRLQVKPWVLDFFWRNKVNILYHISSYLIFFGETMVMYSNNPRFFSASSNKHPTIAKPPPPHPHKVQFQCRFKTKVEELGLVVLNWNQNWD